MPALLKHNLVQLLALMLIIRVDFKGHECEAPRAPRVLFPHDRHVNHFPVRFHVAFDVVLPCRVQYPPHKVLHEMGAEWRSLRLTLLLLLLLLLRGNLVLTEVARALLLLLGLLLLNDRG